MIFFLRTQFLLHSALALQEVEALGPLTGLGYFTIERSTLTSMVSTAATYVIVLVQFRMSAGT